MVGIPPIYGDCGDGFLLGVPHYGLCLIMDWNRLWSMPIETCINLNIVVRYRRWQAGWWLSRLETYKGQDDQPIQRALKKVDDLDPPFMASHIFQRICGYSWPTFMGKNSRSRNGTFDLTYTLYSGIGIDPNLSHTRWRPQTIAKLTYNLVNVCVYGG